jgi:hypothetical protein
MKDRKSMKILNLVSPLHVLHALHGEISFSLTKISDKERLDFVALDARSALDEGP